MAGVLQCNSNDPQQQSDKDMKTLKNNTSPSSPTSIQTTTSAMLTGTSLKDTLTSDPQTWYNSSLVSVTQITSSGLKLLFDTSVQMRSLVKQNGGGDDRFRNKILASVFYEASTRTSCSFQCAMMRLGGKVIHVDGNGNTSASKKGESLSDTIQCLQCYTDVTVLRHGTTGTITDIVENGRLSKPVLNAGDGIGEHPTQALLDLFTIVDEISFTANDEPLVITLLGDLKHGRTVHSLAKLLVRAQSYLKRPLVLRYCSPPSLVMPQHVQEYVANFSSSTTDVKQEEYTSGTEESVKKAMTKAHVLYVTRVQKERFDKEQDYAAVKGTYKINAEIMSHAPSKMIVMHPLPRVDEIHTEVDSDPRAVYFKQMENGMYVRMAILALVLGNSSS